MAEIALTAKERQALKARAHALKPVVLLGAGGLSPAVVREIDRALAAHELVKVKVPLDDRTEREQIFADVAERLSAARVQSIGKLFVLFRPAPEAPGPAPGETATTTMTTANRAPKASAPQPRGKPPAAGPSKPGRRDVERVNRGTAPRRDPGTARRAAGRSNAPKRGR